MKNRIWTDALREVRHTLGRFLSLLLLSALAVSFLAGLRTTAPDMERSADHYYDAQALMDVRVLSTLGLTGGDIAVLAGQPGIAGAEGAYTIDAIAAGVDNDFIVKVLSLGTDINRPRLVAGRLPKTAGECLVEPKLLLQMGLALGDGLVLATGTGTYENALAHSVFTIVGTADSPLYISSERGSSSLGSGRVAAFVLLPTAAFTMEAYTDAYLRAAGGAELLCYSDAYKDKMDALLDALEPLGDARARNRYDEVVGEANAKLADAQAEFDEAEAEVEKKLSDARAELSDARKKLDNGWREYEDGRATFEQEIADAEGEIQEAELVTLPDALQKLEDGEGDYTDGEQKLDDAEVEYRDGLKKYQDGQAKYKDGYDELAYQERTYGNSLQSLRDGETEYAAGYQQYTHGLSALQEGGRQIQENEKKLNDALDALWDGREDLAAGRSQYLSGEGAYQAGQAQFDAQVEPLKQMLGMGGMSSAAFVGTMAQMVTQETKDAVFASLPPQQQAAVGSANGLYAMVRGLVEAQAVLEASNQQLDAAAGDLSSAQQRLDWGEEEYQTGRKALTRAKAEFYDAQKELKDAGKTLTESRNTLREGWTALRSGRVALDEGWASLTDAKRELTDAEDTLADGWQQILDARQTLLDARQALDDGWIDYRQGLQDLEDAKTTLDEEKAKGLRTLRDALDALEDGEVDYAAGLRDYEDGKREADDALSDARRKLNDARREIADIEHCEWYLLGRNTNIGYVSFQSDAQRMGNLASVFPLIFFLVAALVCLTTMTRMVEEQRVQIGSLKAMGYGRGTVSLKYVGYGLTASLLGGGLGLAFGCTVIPWIIYTAFSVLYTLGPLTIPFYPGISLLSVGAAVVTVAGSAALTCRSTLAETPASLMRPKAPKSGKRVLLERITPLWKRLSFTHKVTVRNLFRYKRRFWMTVIGIGGCTALIITGFGLRDSIFSIMDLQYDAIYSYNSQIGLVDDVTEDERAELVRALVINPDVTAFLPAHQTSLSVEGTNRTMDAVLFTAADGATFDAFIHLRHRRDAVPVVLPDRGVVLTEKLATLLNVGPGDEVVLDGDRRVTAQVADVTEHYIGHFVYLSAPAYEALYGVAAGENILLAQYREDTRALSDAVSATLIPLSGVTSVSRSTDMRQTYQQSLESVDYAVLVVIISAAVLAFVVLFNLTNINITERMRELATLKVLGFYDRELSAYVFRENALLSVFGVAAGLVMGKFLHQWLVLTVEIDMLMFGRSAKPISYLFAVVLTLLFAVVVNLVAGRKLKKIDMVESLKSVE